MWLLLIFLIGGGILVGWILIKRRALDRELEDRLRPFSPDVVYKNKRR